jgi:hypothetical protein
VGHLSALHDLKTLGAVSNTICEATVSATAIRHIE